MQKFLIQQYVNNFRRRIARSLKPGMGLKCTVRPALDGGAVLIFQLGENVENDDLHVPAEPMAAILSSIKQSAFGGNLAGIRFHGTNVILESDQIILIKDDQPSEWTDSAAQKDTLRLFVRPRA